jgi:hypothetical protein
MTIRSRFRLAVLALLLPLAFLAGPASGAPRPEYRDMGVLIASRPNGYDYAYAPVLIREAAGWHMLYCGSGTGVGAWDWIRIAASPDGRTWSAPQVALKVSGGARERAACDPSLVRYQAPDDPAPFYYLFYSASPEGTGTAIFVARAPTIEGPFAKWTGKDWQVDAQSPEPVIRPASAHPDGTGFYGAGQQSIVVRDGRLQAWFTDDTTCTPRCEQIFTSRSADPTHWPKPVTTGIAASSVDVKYDPDAGRLSMYAISGPHTFSSYLVRWMSADGVAWGRPEIIAGPTAFTHYAHNLGVGGDEQGHLVPGELAVVFGAPAGPDCGSCWARWDLKGGLVTDR